MKRFFVSGLVFVGMVTIVVVVLLHAGAFDGKAKLDVSADGRHPVTEVPSRKSGGIAATPVSAAHVGREAQKVKIVGTLPMRPVEPNDIAAFNKAVDAGISVEDAAKRSFPEGTDNDGLLAALKLMSVAKDAKTRGGAYKAVARLFADAQDLAAAVSTAKAILAAMPTTASESEPVELGDGTEKPDDSGVKTVSEDSPDKDSGVVSVDDSEVSGADDEAGEESDIPVQAEVEPALDGVQGEEIAKLLKSGVADEDAEVRREALEAASQMEDHFRYGAYEEVLKGSDSALKQSVLELCSQFGREEDVAVQRQALQDADAEVAAAAQKNLDSDAAKAFLEADAAAKADEQKAGTN